MDPQQKVRIRLMRAEDSDSSGDAPSSTKPYLAAAAKAARSLLSKTRRSESRGRDDGKVVGALRSVEATGVDKQDISIINSCDDSLIDEPPRSRSSSKVRRPSRPRSRSSSRVRQSVKRSSSRARFEGSSSRSSSSSSPRTVSHDASRTREKVQNRRRQHQGPQLSSSERPRRTERRRSLPSAGRSHSSRKMSSSLTDMPRVKDNGPTAGSTKPTTKAPQRRHSLTATKAPAKTELMESLTSSLTSKSSHGGSEGNDHGKHGFNLQKALNESGTKPRAHVEERVKSNPKQRRHSLTTTQAPAKTELLKKGAPIRLTSSLTSKKSSHAGSEGNVHGKHGLDLLQALNESGTKPRAHVEERVRSNPKHRMSRRYSLNSLSQAPPPKRELNKYIPSSNRRTSSTARSKQGSNAQNEANETTGYRRRGSNASKSSTSFSSGGNSSGARGTSRHTASRRLPRPISTPCFSVYRNTKISGTSLISSKIASTAQERSVTDAGSSGPTTQEREKMPAKNRLAGDDCPPKRELNKYIPSSSRRTSSSVRSKQGSNAQNEANETTGYRRRGSNASESSTSFSSGGNSSGSRGTSDHTAPRRIPRPISTPCFSSFRNTKISGTSLISDEISSTAQERSVTDAGSSGPTTQEREKMPAKNLLAGDDSTSKMRTRQSRSNLYSAKEEKEEDLVYNEYWAKEAKGTCDGEVEAEVLSSHHLVPKGRSRSTVKATTTSFPSSGSCDSFMYDDGSDHGSLEWCFDESEDWGLHFDEDMSLQPIENIEFDGKTSPRSSCELYQDLDFKEVGATVSTTDATVVTGNIFARK